MAGRRTIRTLAVGLLATVTTTLGGCTEAHTADQPALPAALGNQPADFAVRGRWPEKGHPELHYRLDTSRAPLAAPNCERAIARAAAAWNDTGLVRITPAASTTREALTIGWFRGHHGACQPFGTGADIAHAGPVARTTFLHFDGDREWTEDLVFSTALHEFGHVLGLGHSQVEAAVMGTAKTRPSRLTMHELAGLHALYGGPDSLPAIDSDLVIEGSTTVLRRVAPAPVTAFAVFDTDGDEDAEVLVWRTDPAGHGTLTVFHFTAGRRLSHTRGPFPGVIAAGANVGFVVTDGGGRYLVCHCDNGRVLLRQFDDHGLPGNPRQPLAPELADNATAASVGDLDGDGSVENVSRIATAR